MVNEHVNAALVAAAAMWVMAVGLMGVSMGLDAAGGALIYGVSAVCLGVALGWSAASMKASGNRR